MDTNNKIQSTADLDAKKNTVAKNKKTSAVNHKSSPKAIASRETNNNNTYHNSEHANHSFTITVQNLLVQKITSNLLTRR